MAKSQAWLRNLDGVDALAILTDSDLLSHKNGHALFFDGVESLENTCIIISADPEYFFQNLKSVKSIPPPSAHSLTRLQALQTRKHTLAYSCPTSPVYANSLDQIIAAPILRDQVAYLESGTCTIRPIYVRKRSDRDAVRGDTLIFIKEYHLNLGSLLYTSSWLAAKSQCFAEIPTEGSIARIERSDVIRYTNDYYIYQASRPHLQDEQTSLIGLDRQTVVVHNHLSYWTPVFKETWTFFPEHAPYQPTSQSLFRQELWTAAKTGYLCDVRIHGDGFEIPAHCIVLRSVPYYKVLFASSLSEGLESRQRHYQPTAKGNGFTGKGNILPTSVQTLRAPPFATESVLRGFLYYVYMGRLPLDVFVSSTFALDLLLLADFYSYPELVRDAAHALRIDDPELVLQIADSIEETPSVQLLKARATEKQKSED